MAYPAVLSSQDNFTTSASLSSSSAVAAYPLANAVALPISKPWRTTGCTSEYIEFDFGAAKAWTLISIINHNLTSAATITVYAGSSPNPGSSVGTIAWRKYDAFSVAYAVNQRYVRIVFADSTNPLGFLQIGYIMAGSFTQFVAGVAFDYPFEDAYQNLKVQTEYHVPHVAKLDYQVNLQFTFNQLSVAAMATIRALFQESFSDLYPLFWITDSAVNDGYFMRFGGTLKRTLGVYSSAPITLNEENRGKLITS